MISDDFGDGPPHTAEEATLTSYTRWLHKIANSYLDPADARHDDLVQEGWIAMWRALGTYDPAKGALPSWLTQAAKMRMRALAFGRAQPTGREDTRGRREAPIVASVDELLDAGADAIIGACDALEGTELAYHHGEIWKALEALSPSQRRYVFARFWTGLDPSSREPTQKDLRALVPEISKRYLWTGSGKQVGAQQRLASALAHLQP